MDDAKRIVKKFTFFIGIDVSKITLDLAVMKEKILLFHREIPNQPNDIIAFVNELKNLKGFRIAKAVFCMEQTGFYCNHLLRTLAPMKANITVENAVKIKNSMGLLRGKDDKVDALRAAYYAQRNMEELKLWAPRRPVINELNHFSTLRQRMLTLALAVKTPLKEQKTFIGTGLQGDSVAFCKKTSEALKQDLAAIDAKIEDLINGDVHIKRLKQLITSIPGIGVLTAIQIIICTNEFKDISDPKKFACYAGIAPFKKESGRIRQRARVSYIANRKMKMLLHLCAMVSLRSNEELKTFFDRKTKSEGKPAMAVMNAIRYKLILRVFACVKQDRLYIKEYLRPELNIQMESTNQQKLTAGALTKS